MAAAIGDWGDEEEPEAPPQPVAPVDDLAPPAGLAPLRVARPAGGSPASRLRANSGPGEPPSPHADRQLPDRPPYTAFVGNVPYGCGPEDVYRIFEGLEVRAGPRRRRAGAGG